MNIAKVHRTYKDSGKHPSKEWKFNYTVSDASELTQPVSFRKT